ncbi:hypothetical protein IWZ01DRAFT_3735 [Phyllosticta capitalensis]
MGKYWRIFSFLLRCKGPQSNQGGGFDDGNRPRALPTYHVWTEEPSNTHQGVESEVNRVDSWMSPTDKVDARQPRRPNTSMGIRPPTPCHGRQASLRIRGQRHKVTIPPRARTPPPAVPKPWVSSGRDSPTPSHVTFEFDDGRRKHLVPVYRPGDTPVHIVVLERPRFSWRRGILTYVRERLDWELARHHQEREIGRRRSRSNLSARSGRGKIRPRRRRWWSSFWKTQPRQPKASGESIGDDYSLGPRNFRV